MRRRQVVMQSGKSNATLCNQCANMDTEKKKKKLSYFHNQTQYVYTFVHSGPLY